MTNGPLTLLASGGIYAYGAANAFAVGLQGGGEFVERAEHAAVRAAALQLGEPPLD